MARIEHPGGEGGVAPSLGRAAAAAAAAAQNPQPSAPMSTALIFLFAFAAGAAVANIYYVQPLIGLIGPDIGLSPVLASLMVTFTQLGYAAGLVLLVPLGDLVENRSLVVLTLLAVSASLAISAVAGSEPAFFAAALTLGCCAVVAQMLVPFAATLSPEAQRGATVGIVISGVMTGILLARPIASLIADFAGWRAVFGLAAILMVLLAGLLRWNLPIRRPAGGFAYWHLIASLWPVWRDTAILRRRALYQAAMFAAFSLFWTTVPLLLASPAFGWSQRGIAVFALAGAAGALISPVAGRIADRGWTKPATGVALFLVIFSFAIAAVGAVVNSIAILVVAAVLLDVGCILNLVLGQRAIYVLGPEIRSRLNALYMATTFLGGAVGSAIASAVYFHGGWIAASCAGAAFGVIASLYYAGEFFRPRPA